MTAVVKMMERTGVWYVWSYLLIHRLKNSGNAFRVPIPANERLVVVSSVVISPSVEMAPPAITMDAMLKPPTASPTRTQKPSSQWLHGTSARPAALAPTSTGGMYVARPATTISTSARTKVLSGFATSSITLPALSKPEKFHATTGKKSAQLTSAGTSLMRPQSKPCGI